jgi:hypothetical protein
MVDLTPSDWNEPKWIDAGRIHDWRNYVSEEIQYMWSTFTEEQKKAIARQAEENALDEEWE